jgi:acyl-CoA synthetase (AMP-forming)/AMP-acid ligase II
VGEAVCFSVPDPKYGEEVHAAVVLKGQASAADIQQFFGRPTSRCPRKFTSAMSCREPRRARFSADMSRRISTRSREMRQSGGGQAPSKVAASKNHLTYPIRLHRRRESRLRWEQGELMPINRAAPILPDLRFLRKCSLALTSSFSVLFQPSSFLHIARRSKT